MAKTIKYPFPQEPRKVMQEEKITFIQRVICVYRMLFWMFLPFIIPPLPLIAAVLFNEWYALFIVITFPVGIALFGFVTENKI